MWGMAIKSLKETVADAASVGMSGSQSSYGRPGLNVALRRSLALGLCATAGALASSVFTTSMRDQHSTVLVKARAVAPELATSERVENSRAAV